MIGCGRIGFDQVGEQVGDGADVDGVPAWALVQTTASTSQPLAIAPSRDASLIVVAVHAGNAGSVTSITDDAPNGGNAYIAIPAARATNASPSDGLEIWYAKNVRAGATAINIVVTTSIIGIVAWEVVGIHPDDPLDSASKLDTQPATTTPAGPSITTSEAGEFVVSVAIVANGVSGIHAGNAFTNDHRTRGNGWAHLTTPMAPAGSYQAQWDQGAAGAYCANAAAFRLVDR